MAFPELKAFNKRYNAPTNESGTTETPDNIRNEIGVELFSDLEARNRLDMQLYQYAVDRFFSVVPNN
jgi:hypothetical protein